MYAGITGGLVWIVLYYLLGTSQNTASLIGLPAAGFAFGHLLNLPTSIRIGRHVRVTLGSVRGRR